MIVSLGRIEKNSTEKSYGTIYSFRVKITNHYGSDNVREINTNYRGDYLRPGLNRNLVISKTKSGRPKIAYSATPDRKLDIIVPTDDNFNNESQRG